MARNSNAENNNLSGVGTGDIRLTAGEDGVVILALNICCGIFAGLAGVLGIGSRPGVPGRRTGPTRSIYAPFATAHSNAVEWRRAAVARREGILKMRRPHGLEGSR